MGSVSTISSTSASNKKTPIVKTMAARKILQEASPSNQISISDLPQPREELMFSTPLVLSKLNLTSKSKPKPKPKPMQVLKPNPKLEERLTRSPMYSLYSGELTIAPLRALNESAKNKVTQSFQDALNTSSNPSTSSRPSKRTATESDLPLKKKRKKTTTLKLETRNEFELTSPTSIISRSSPTPPPKNSRSDYYIKEIPNRITKARSLTAYIETSTASTSTIVRTTSNTIMPITIDHDSSDSDLGERELYPLGDKNATTYKKVSAESTSAISSRYIMNDIIKNKSKARAGKRDLREGKKKNNQLKQDKKNSEQFKKKKVLQK